jgi:hypothetical protein
MFHGLFPLAWSESGLISETRNAFRRFGRTPWMEDRSAASPVPAKDNTTQHKERGYISMPRERERERIEHRIPLFEQCKTVHVLDRAATGIG